MFFGLWAWWILCAPDTLAWNVAFMIGNYVHAIYMFIKVKRPRKFSKECEAVYERLFEQYGVKRFQFEQLAKKCSVIELNQGDCYGKEGTPAERISILLEGRSVYEDYAVKTLHKELGQNLRIWNIVFIYKVHTELEAVILFAQQSKARLPTVDFYTFQQHVVAKTPPLTSY